MPPPPLPTPPVRSSPFAVASLVFGFLSFCGALLGILAVVFGHIGNSRIRKSGGTLGGAGMCKAGLILGYTSLTLWTLFFGALFLGVFGAFNLSKDRKRLSTAPYDVTSQPIPGFPDVPVYQKIEGTNIQVGQVNLRTSGAEFPGATMSLRIYLPEGDLVARTRTCVLVAPAGTNLMTGQALEELGPDAYHDECLPYAQAGMVVVFYSLDGPMDDEMPGDTKEQLADAYSKFVASEAGLINARNALEFALNKLPMVAPDRIYTAGHSSAATLSLLFAEHESRVAGCLAYAPVTDVSASIMERFSEDPGFSALPQTSRKRVLNDLLPGLADFIKRSSPNTHITRLKVPVFLFHAEDDETVNTSQNVAFAKRLNELSSNATLVTVPDGGHYGSMIKDGIPKGIEWIRNQESRRSH